MRIFKIVIDFKQMPNAQFKPILLYTHDIVHDLTKGKVLFKICKCKFGLPPFEKLPVSSIITMCFQN